MAVKESSQVESPLSSTTSPSGRTSLLSIFGSTALSTSHRKNRGRLGSEDEHLRKSRRIVAGFLRRVGALLAKDISFNSNGVAYFSYRRFVIVVEVPQDNPHMVFIYTMVAQLKESDNQAAVLKLAMNMNYLQNGTRGATLGLDGEELNLCQCFPVQGLSYAVMRRTVENFLQTAIEVNQLTGQLKRKLAIEKETN